MNMIQFELWKQCNNNCDFCWNKPYTQINDPKQKIDRIHNAIEKIDTLNTFEYDTIGLIGGEFFEGQLIDPCILSHFLYLIDRIAVLLQKEKIKQCLITASFMKKDFLYLDMVVNRFKQHNCLDKVLWCTSYDEKGRFHTEEQRQIWFNNIEKFTKYGLQIHVEIIVTQALIDSILNNSLNLAYFFEKDINVDFLRPQVIEGKTKKEMIEKLPYFFPSRNSFFKFLNFINDNYPEKLKDLFSLENRARKIFMADESVMIRDTNNYIENIEKDVIMPCRHSKVFCGYSDTDDCMICDINKFKQDL